MTRNILLTALLCGGLFASAQELPKPSPLGTVSQKVGLTDITIEYSRPSAKGRTIFGDLVPYGKLWRTGANMNTLFTCSGPISIGGSDVPAGTYSLFTIPQEEGGWEIIFNKKTDHAGTGDYNQEADVVRFIADDQNVADFVETLTIGIGSIVGDRAELYLAWENTRVTTVFAVNSIDQAKKNIAEALAKDDADFRAYNSSARYYLDNNLDLDKAVDWSKTSVGMEKRFWNVYTFSLLLAAREDYKGAITAAQESLDLAKEEEYEPYIKMNSDNIAKWEKMLQ
jgi:tetratricopeptide (TPR) repeat protein